MAEAALAERQEVTTAPVVETADVEVVNRAELRPLYKAREKIHPKLARGTFRRLKWLVMASTLSVYYLSPWLRWDRGPNAPDQAILIDFPGRRFYFFFIEIWPQEIYYLTGLLIIAAVTLFLITSLAGRVWCGYTCPQTVWTDLFIAIERLVEGDRGARIRLDKRGWSFAKLGRKIVKHALWIVVAIGTGGAWVFYFADAPTLGAIAREQICIYMCPWPRIQAAMLDEETLTVTYRHDRGEPRGPYRKHESWDDRGHCIDCKQCVVVCPTGIDIRDGLQLECISCALCVDACNDVMTRVGLPRGLIAYDTDNNISRRLEGEATRFNPIRPRTIIYGAIIATVGLIMLGSLLTRSSLELNVLGDRNPLYTTLADGSIRNGYTVKILNKRHQGSVFDLQIEGLVRPNIKIAGAARDGIHVPADSLKSFRVFLSMPAKNVRSDISAIRFLVRDRTSGESAATDSQFRGPKR